MFTTPYQTTLISRRYQMEQIIAGVRRADIEAPLEVMKTPMGKTIRDVYIVTPSSDYDDLIGFTQCIDIGKPNSPKLVVDARPFMRSERHTNTYRLVSQNDYMFQCIRAALSLQQIENGNDPFIMLGRVPVVTFIRWITQSLTNIYQLSLESQIQISIIVAYYYHCLLKSDDIEYTESEKALLAQKIGQYTSVTSTKVLDVIIELKQLKNADDLINAIKEHSKSVRLKDLSFENLYMLISNSWIGVNARENVGVALEHIPTWIALVYMAVDEKSYRKTILAQRAQYSGKQNDIKYFVERTHRIVMNQFE